MSNTITLVGRLTKDPETKETSGGIITKFSVACDNDDKDKTTTFFNVTSFGKSAEFVAKYITKGRMVLVSGSIKSNQGSDGKTYWQVDASKVKGLDRAKDDAPRPTAKPATDSSDDYDPFGDE